MNMFTSESAPGGRRRLRAAAAIGGALILLTACWAYWDYRAWLRLGVGGLPGDFKGWMRTTRLRLQMLDPLNMTTLRRMMHAKGSPAYLAQLPIRPTARPRIAPHPVPHRQLTQRAEPHLLAALHRVFDAAVADNADKVEYALSHFEKHTKAITSLSRAGDPLEGASHGEIAHIHSLDGSMHMILSPADTIAAVEAGWAELHGLAGKAVGLPANYLLVYAPQSDQDVSIASRLVTAAIAYMTGVPAERL